MVDTPASSAELPRVRRLLKIDFKNPEEDYIFIQNMPSNEGILACHRRSRLRLVVVRESHSSAPLHMLGMYSRIRHANIASIIAVYFYNSQLLIVSEYLDVSLLDLASKKPPLEEWEVATVVKQVGLHRTIDTILIQTRLLKP